MDFNNKVQFSKDCFKCMIAIHVSCLSDSLVVEFGKRSIYMSGNIHHKIFGRLTG